MVTAAIGQGLRAEDVDRLVRLLASRGRRSPVGLALTMIRQGEARDELAAAAPPAPAPTPSATRADSSMAAVSASNPYGWQGRGASALQQYYDHDEPSKWNAYRQSYNLSAAERQAAGATDHRRRGCSRFEALGVYGNGAVPSIDAEGQP